MGADESKKLRAALAIRFWQNVAPPDSNGCRNWTGSISNKHGRFHLRVAERPLLDGRKDVSAHLFSWWLINGTYEKFVDRSCGNTLCVEPSHLNIRTAESRFWRNVDKETTPDGCWPWLGGKHTFGYGSTFRGSAHRVAYELTYGPIPAGAVIRHLCHNPICCRPDHLACGTQYDNIHDAIDAGRMPYARGERAGFAKFSNEQAAALRDVFAAVRKTRLQNASLSVLATLLNVTPRTVWRIVKGKAYKTEGVTFQKPARQEVSVDVVEQLVAEFRQQGFPWSVVQEANDKDAIIKVTTAKVLVEQDIVTSVSRVGQKICLAAHPHRMEAKHKGQPSVVEAFNDDRILARALRYQLERGDPVTPKRVLRALQAFVRAPRNFPPALARWLIDRYTPNGGTVLDPCSGYGGRLLGAAASQQEVSYIGFDVEAKTVLGNRDLARRIGWQQAEVRVQAVESDVLWPTVDLVITSPPYYDREWYGVDSATKLIDYPTYKAWCDGFLKALINKSLQAAPVVILNVALLKTGKVEWDIPGDTARITVAAGGHVERILSWPLQAFGKPGREEKLLVLRR